MQMQNDKTALCNLPIFELWHSFGIRHSKLVI